ncbi:MAG: hypothetical protein FJY19_08080 [Bacteroidetes bacterium]|nr:hypothetical protein [Bacteroidota bacterium]
MNKFTLLGLFLLLFSVNDSWAYGGGGAGGTKSCEKPKFSDFSPAENAEVAPGSAFSFTASKNTYPATIKVTVKGQAAAIKTDKKNDGTFSVKGSLPAAVKGDFARIAITADAQSNCKGSSGWLVKVSE